MAVSLGGAGAVEAGFVVEVPESAVPGWHAATLFNEDLLKGLAQTLYNHIWIIGVNNRNLRTLDVNVRASEELIEKIPREVIAVSESGLRSSADLERLRALGYRAFLIGERFMAAADPGAQLRTLVSCS